MKQKTVKRIVVPPKIRENPLSYPPYVSRIMKISARGHQNQTEIPDDNQCTNEELTQTRFDELGTESASRACLWLHQQQLEHSNCG